MAVRVKKNGYNLGIDIDLLPIARHLYDLINSNRDLCLMDCRQMLNMESHVLMQLLFIKASLVFSTVMAVLAETASWKNGALDNLDAFAGRIATIVDKAVSDNLVTANMLQDLYNTIVDIVYYGKSISSALMFFGQPVAKIIDSVLGLILGLIAKPIYNNIGRPMGIEAAKYTDLFGKYTSENTIESRCNLLFGDASIKAIIA